MTHPTLEDEQYYETYITIRRDKLASLEAEVERLRAALEPFIWSTLPVKADAMYTLHVRGSDILRGRAALTKEKP